MIDDVLNEYRCHTRSPFKIAKRLGVSIDYVLDVIDSHQDELLTSYKETHGGHGRPSLQRYLVARKRATAEWDNNEPLIAKARADYEAGTHEMCSGRDGSWIILYSIPRAVVRPRPHYFRPEL